jgi:hypothetical protein
MNIDGGATAAAAGLTLRDQSKERRRLDYMRSIENRAIEGARTSTGYYDRINTQKKSSLQ